MTQPETAHTHDPDVSRSELKEATFTGVRWVLVARMVGEISAFGAAVTLARLIPPAEFGHAAVALAIAPLAVIVTFEGCASALVQRKTVSRADFEGATVLSLACGLILTLLTAFLAEPLGSFVFGDRTASLIALAAPVFLLAAIGAVPRALLWRRLDFRRVSMIEVLGMLVGAAVAVVLALVYGLDAEAIIGGALATTAANSLLLFASAPVRPALIRAPALRGIASFGVPAALAGLVHVAFTNVNYLILAARMSPTQAGLYWRAFQIGVSYQEKLSGVMLRIAFPIYARTSSPEDLRHLHQRASRLHATILLPLLALLVVCAPVAVPWAFGPAWVDAVAPTQVLAVAGMIAAVLTGYPQVMLAVGQPRALLRFNIAILVLYAIVTIVTIPYGLTAVCIAVVGVHAVILLGVYGLLLRRYVGIPISRLFSDIAPAAVGCVTLVVVTAPLVDVMRGAGLPAPVLLAIAGIAGGATYLITIRFAFHAAWSDVELIARRVIPSRRARRRDDATAVPALGPGVS